MRAAKEELTESWLLKAKRDLRSADELAHVSPPLLDTAAYHCQQAAEKAIKGFLLFNDVRFEKTHDIEVLISQACEVDATFCGCCEAARILTPLAIEFRYPGDYVEPDADEYRAAYEAAVMVYDFIVQKLPSSITS